MKTVIFAGGLGTRLQEETVLKPKPMVEVGGKPILWHIMKIYESHGYSEFVVALGYKGEVIKDYFLKFRELNSDLTLDFKTGDYVIHNGHHSHWKVHLMDTGEKSMTGGRLKRLAPLLADETFMVTYGDGVADVDIPALVKFHRSHGKLATVTAVRQPARFGGLRISDSSVKEFAEKPRDGEGWINGGFFILEPGVLEYIDGDDMSFEREPLSRLAKDGQLMAFEHEGFFQPMDTLREKNQLEELWNSGKAPWRVWND